MAATVFRRPCSGCGVQPGALHLENCDLEPCAACGGQRLSCGCSLLAHRMAWTGEWPGATECREFGWFAKLVPGLGWVSCSPQDPEAHEDLNRLYRDAVWDTKNLRWARRG